MFVGILKNQHLIQRIQQKQFFEGSKKGLCHYIVQRCFPSSLHVRMTLVEVEVVARSAGESTDTVHLPHGMPGHRDLRPQSSEPDKVPWITGPAAATGTWHAQTRCRDLTHPDTWTCCRNQACLTRCLGRQDCKNGDTKNQPPNERKEGITRKETK